MASNAGVDRQAIKTPSNTARPLFQKRREERITTEHEESVRQQIIFGSDLSAAIHFAERVKGRISLA